MMVLVLGLSFGEVYLSIFFGDKGLDWGMIILYLFFSF